MSSEVKKAWRTLEQRRSDSRLINSIHVINICTKANWTLAFRRILYACPQEVKEAAYKGLVRSVLEYGSDWDLSGVGLQNELEKVQNRAARFVTGNYKFETGSMTGILEHLKLESLKKRRRDSIRTDDLTPCLCAAGMVILWHIRSPLLTLIFISSFSLQTIRDWNALPDSLISSAEGAEDGVAKFTSLVRARD